MKLFTAIVAMLFFLTGCNNMLNKLSRVNNGGPELKKMDPPVSWSEGYNEQNKKHHNSLWRQGARAFFKDNKARRIGDILKVTINIKDKANLNNSSKTKRITNESLNLPNLFGAEGVIKKAAGVSTTSPIASVAGTGNTEGTGSIARTEDIATEIAAIVTQILPNSNLVISGSQQIRINYEVREITVTGIVRPEDIGADNSISSDQIAEARISYGGEGTVSDIQQPRYGQQILEAVMPF